VVRQIIVSGLAAGPSSILVNVLLTHSRRMAFTGKGHRVGGESPVKELWASLISIVLIGETGYGQ
jgi:hypothetical protein